MRAARVAGHRRGEDGPGAPMIKPEPQLAASYKLCKELVPRPGPSTAYDWLRDAQRIRVKDDLEAQRPDIRCPGSRGAGDLGQIARILRQQAHGLHRDVGRAVVR